MMLPYSGRILQPQVDNSKSAHAIQIEMRCAYQAQHAKKPATQSPNRYHGHAACELVQHLLTKLCFVLPEIRPSLPIPPRPWAMQSLNVKRKHHKKSSNLCKPKKIMSLRQALLKAFRPALPPLRNKTAVATSRLAVPCQLILLPRP